MASITNGILCRSCSPVHGTSFILNESERWEIIRPNEARKAVTREDRLPREYSTHKPLPTCGVIDRRVRRLGRICQLCLYQFVHHLLSLLCSPLYNPPSFPDQMTSRTSTLNLPTPACVPSSSKVHPTDARIILRQIRSPHSTIKSSSDFLLF